MKVNLVFFCSILILCMPAIANTVPSAAETQAGAPSVSAISELAKALIYKKISAPTNARVDISPQAIDRRMLPSQCASPLRVELASDREINRNNTLKVSCDTPDLTYPWQMFISVRVDILFPVVVANATLAPGELIQPHQLAIRYIEQNNLRGMQFSSPVELEGARVKRRVAKEAPILANNLCFVCKNDAISIHVRSASFTLKTPGEALQDGNQGERIKVKNSSSNKTLDAIVTGIGEVEVKM
ncbi:MAG: flagellar basal body P-ring formation chaperone FlgA [Shewanella sp.]